MESKHKRRPADNSLPNTIVIQLMSQQPQAMPISVKAIPLLPGSKAPVEQQQQRPPSLSPNPSLRAAGPPQMPSKIRPEMSSPPRRRTPPVQFQNSAPRNNQSNTGQGRTLLYRMECVLQPEDGVAPIYNPPPRPAGNYYSSDGRVERMEADCHCSCCKCRNVRRWIPEPEQMSPRPNNDTPQPRRSPTKPEDRRDQATNTHDEPQDLQSLKMICETVGRAMVAAATAVVEATVQKSQSPADRLQGEVDILAQAMAQLQREASEEYDRDRETEQKTSFSASSDDEKIEMGYPNAPSSTMVAAATAVLEATAQKSQSPADRSQGEADILAQLHREASEEKMSFSELSDDEKIEMGYPKAPSSTIVSDVSELDTQIKGFSGLSIRRRLPTEDIQPLKGEECPGPTSPGAATLMVEQSEVPGPSTVASSTDLSIGSPRPGPSTVASSTDLSIGSPRPN